MWLEIIFQIIFRAFFVATWGQKFEPRPSDPQPDALTTAYFIE